MILADLLGAGTVILCGILIKYVKLYDLMAGYNMLSPEEKAKVEEIGSRKSEALWFKAYALGHFCFFGLINLGCFFRSKLKVFWLPTAVATR